MTEGRWAEMHISMALNVIIGARPAVERREMEKVIRYSVLHLVNRNGMNGARCVPTYLGTKLTSL